MPMDFPDMASLKYCAKAHGFRMPEEGEREELYRGNLASFVEPRDFVESQEIRNKVGWDKFSKDQKEMMVIRSIVSAKRPN